MADALASTIDETSGAGKPARFTLIQLMLLAQGEAVELEEQQKRLVAAGFRTEPYGPAMLRATGFYQIAATLEWLDQNADVIRDAVRNAPRGRRR